MRLEFNSKRTLSLWFQQFELKLAVKSFRATLDFDLCMLASHRLQPYFALKGEYLSMVTVRSYLSQSVCKVVLHKSIPTQIRQHFLYISNSKG